MLHPKVLNEYKIFYNLDTVETSVEKKMCLPPQRVTVMSSYLHGRGSKDDRIYTGGIILMFTVSIIAVLIGLLLPAVQVAR